MSALSYAINVSTPCTGNQIVSKVASTYYTGSGGDFTYVILSRAPQDTAWKVTLYDYGRSSACSPEKLYEQATPDANDPAGSYYCVGSNGPDQSLGELSVTEYP